MTMIFDNHPGGCNN